MVASRSPGRRAADTWGGLHGGVSAHLVVSLSGIRPATLDACAELATELDARRVPLSLLVVPRAPGSAGWVRRRRDGGDAVVLHGYDPAVHPTGTGYPRRRAEFAALPAHEAGLRLHAAGELLAGLGLATDAFVPPRWLGSPGTLRALRSRGFRTCADAVAVRDLRTGYARRARVLGFGPAAEPWWCRALVLGAGRTARRGGLVRLTVDGSDLLRPARRMALLDAVDLTLHHGAHATTYPAVAREPALT